MLALLIPIFIGGVLMIISALGSISAESGHDAYVRKHNYDPVRQRQLEWRVRARPEEVTAETGVVYDCNSSEGIRKALQWYGDKEGWKVGPLIGEYGYTADLEYLKMARVPKSSPAWSYARYLKEKEQNEKNK